MTENFSEIINEETAPQKLLQWSGEYERTCGHKPLALIHTAVSRTSATVRK